MSREVVFHGIVPCVAHLIVLFGKELAVGKSKFKVKIKKHAWYYFQTFVSIKSKIKT
ncbi:MAG: hypothetical protein JWN76_1546 [Chitinophagaceae bacterium]|nr:hypothetical protein [Chitinophagaceae bacterium]